MYVRHVSLALVLSLAASHGLAQGSLFQFTGFDGPVGAAGDLDHDGRVDCLVADTGQHGKVGRVVAFSSANGGVLVSVVANAVDDGFATAIAGGADLDLDGTADFVVGAPSNAGFPYVRAYSGATGASLWTLQGSPGSRFGVSVALTGDVDGDGTPDVVIGAPDGGAAGAGEALVRSGASGASLRTHTGANGAQGEFGLTVAACGDIDGDAVAEYVVGDPRVSFSGAPGSAEVHSGATGAALATFVGAKANDEFGSGLAAVGDVDGDGRDELAIGARAEAIDFATTGSVALVSPALGVVLHTTPASFGTVGFGVGLAGLGDYDGDGVRDYAAHYPWVLLGDVIKNFGRVRILSGATGRDIGMLTIGFRGPIACVGDVDGDAIPDLLIGGGPAPFPSGYAELFAGQSSSPTIYCTAKTSSKGCTPVSGFVDAPGGSFGPGVTVTVTAAPRQKNAIVYWSASAATTPFGGGWLCVGAPRTAAAVLSTAGAGSDCSGSLAYTFTPAYAIAHGFGAGWDIHVQCWMRDPGFAPPQNLNLTAGVSFPYWP